jgi:hypothetical protein
VLAAVDDGKPAQRKRPDCKCEKAREDENDPWR